MLLDELVGVDAGARTVRLRDGRTLPFDYLVLATGSVYSYFGHADWPRYAPGLKSIDDATDIPRRLLIAFEKAETTDDAEARQRRAQRRRHRGVVRRRRGDAGGALAGRGSGPRRDGEGRARPFRAGPSLDLRHRRCRAGARSQRQAASRGGAGGEAARPLRRR